MYRLDLLRQLMGDDDAYVVRFIEAFRSEMPGQAELLGVYLRTGELDSASILAHSLKSQLKYLMADEAVALAYRIEQETAKGIGREELMPVVTRLTAIIDEICRAMHAGHGAS